MQHNLIITATDAAYADFVHDHWLRSLRENVSLADTDILVLDYGMTSGQRQVLSEAGVTIIAGSTSGHVVSMRFIDAAAFLKTHDYRQVLFIDGGDIIFQTDIAPLFHQHPTVFRAVALDNAPRFAESLAYQRHLSAANFQKINAVLHDKPVLNAGVIFGPATLFIKLGALVEELVNNKKSYGPDQMVVNYALYTSGVALLDRNYNYLLGTARDGIHIRDGVFYTQKGKKIAIVHNGGHTALFRPVKNFGYGPHHNQLKQLTYLLKNSFFKLLSRFN